MLTKIKEKFGSISFPGWLFTALMLLYHEGMLHLWVAEPLRPWRFLAVLLMAMGCGLVVGLLTTLITSPKWQKVTAVTAATLMTVIWLTMYFVSDAYQVFMHPATIIGGAGGVAEDYFHLVVSLLVRNLWRIGLMLLPTVLYALFCKTEKVSWKLRGNLAAAAVVLYILGVGTSQKLAGDAARFGKAYSFDSAVRSLGLHMALVLETAGASVQEEEPTFVVTPVETPQPTQPVSETIPLEEQENPAVVYGDQVIAGVDYAALAQETGDPTLKSIYQYIASQSVGKKNEYTGIFQGKNLILITAEAFTAEAVDPELTPTLYRMANEGIHFQEYYQPAWGASTTSGEFSNLMGIVPTNGGMCMREAIYQKFFLNMGFQLQKQGYTSFAYHNHNHDFYERNRTHLHLGYDQFLAQYGGLEGITPIWPESDRQMIDVTIDHYIDKQPFSIYYMTVSGHSVYNWKEHAMAAKHQEKVAHLDHSETVKCYLAAQLELEEAMTTLVGYLEEAGIADDTVIVISTDHYPYGLERSGTWKNSQDYLAELYGDPNWDKFDRDHNALIIWSGCLEDMDLTVEGPVYSMDILPTVSNLFGVEYDSRLLVGRDVFSEEEALVLWPDYSWKTSKGTFDAEDNTFTPREGITVEDGYVERISAKVANKLTYSRSVLNADFFRHLDNAIN